MNRLVCADSELVTRSRLILLQAAEQRQPSAVNISLFSRLIQADRIFIALALPLVLAWITLFYHPDSSKRPSEGCPVEA